MKQVIFCPISKRKGQVRTIGRDLNGKELGKGITQRKNGVYQACVHIKGYGKPIYASSKDLKEIRRKKEAILERCKCSLRVDARNITLNNWFDEWMELYVVGKVKKSTISNYIVEYGMCREYIGNTAIDRLHTFLIQRMVNELLRKGYKKSSVQIVISVLSMCLERAVIARIILFNPCKGVVVKNDAQFTPVNIEKRDLKRLSNETLESFFKYANGTRYYELFVILMNTEMRIGEACALEWKDIDFTQKYISVYKTIGRPMIYYDNKGNKLETPYYLTQITSPKKDSSVRRIPLTNAAEKAFYDWKLKQERDKKKMGKKWGKSNVLLKNYPGLIFTTQTGECYLPKPANQECRRIAKIMNKDKLREAEQKGEVYEPVRVHPHLFRHTFISLCYESGMDPSAIMNIVGHKHIEMLEHYTHLDNSFIDKEFDKVRIIIQ